MLQKVKDLIVIVPAFHIASAFIYLFFYYNSFGNGLVYFASPTDVFSVSIADVASSYLAIFAGAAITHVFFRDPERGNVYQHERRSDEENEKRAPADRIFYKAVVWFFVIVSIINFLFCYAYWYKSGFRLLLMERMGAQTFVVAATLFTASRFNLSKNNFDILSIGALVVVTLSYQGAMQGQMDSALSRKDAYNRVPICGDYQLLRGISQYLLVVGPSDERILLDLDCRKRFELISKARFKALPGGAPKDVIWR